VDIKRRIQGARARAVLAVNAEQIRLYHDLGREILARIDTDGWGTSVIERLSRDLRKAFPDMRGLSTRNLWYMRRFAAACPEMRFLQQPAAELPWFHIVTLLTAVEEPAPRAWYASRAVAAGWSRDVLVAQVRSGAHLRPGKALTNFERRLPAAQAGLAEAVLKDPYHFDFLGLGEEAHERDIERGLVQHVTRFLLELGAGFAFVGRQFRLEVGGDEFFLDLLFYHTRLKCFVVVELKASDFAPEHVGKLNFYLSAVDAEVRAPDDRATIGILLCRRKNRIVAEYALSGIDKPIGVAEYQLVRALPDPLERSLPSIEQLEEELSRELAGDGDAAGKGGAPGATCKPRLQVHPEEEADPTATLRSFRTVRPRALEEQAQHAAKPRKPKKKPKEGS
jgi:predicted nuclease of restriction endonuclease-like (RecB) superfamily